MRLQELQQSRSSSLPHDKSVSAAQPQGPLSCELRHVTLVWIGVCVRPALLQQDGAGGVLFENAPSQSACGPTRRSCASHRRV